MGRPDASLEDIQQAAHMAHAHTFITRLPEGYNTQARGVENKDHLKWYGTMYCRILSCVDN